MQRQRWLRIAVAAAVVLAVAGALTLATRPGEPGGGPPDQGGGPTSARPGPRGAEGPENRAGAGTSEATTPGRTPATGPAAALPEGHPVVEPQPDEKTQISIQWIGQSCFYIQSPQQIVVVTDPFDPGFTGYWSGPLNAHIVTISHEHADHNAANRVQPFTGMGEKDVRVVRDGSYHRGDVTVTAIPSFHDAHQGAERGKNRIFLIESGALRIAHLGDLGHILDPEQVRALGRVDILLVPVGGTYTIGPNDARQVVEQLRPRVVIPMHYRTERTSPGLAGQLLPVTDFTVSFHDVEFRNDFVLLVGANTLPKETAVRVLKARP